MVNNNNVEIKKKFNKSENYISEKQLGSGSYGSTFKVRHKENGNVYCLKSVQVLNQQNIQKVIEEGRILSVMDNVNIIKLHDSYFDNGNYILIMEFAENGDLFQMIEKRKRDNQIFTDFEIMHYFCQLVIALNYIHSQNIIHRDIKPKNIVLSKGIELSTTTTTTTTTETNNGDNNNNNNINTTTTPFLLKIADFGVSKLMSESDLYTNTTAGTPQYVSPEVCQRKQYTNKTDIWSLGVVLYELMTLSLPFDGKKDTVMRNIQTETLVFKPVNHPNEELSALLFKLLNRNPDNRFSTQQILNQVFIREFIEAHMVDYYKRFNTNIDGVFKVVSKKFKLPFSSTQISDAEREKLEHEFILVKLQEMKDRVKSVEENHLKPKQPPQSPPQDQQPQNEQQQQQIDNNKSNNKLINYGVLKKVSIELNFNLDDYCYETLGMLIELVRSKLEGKDKNKHSKCFNYLNNKQSVFTEINSKINK